MEWQPIETAPKDGEGVLLCVRCPQGAQYIVIGSWEDDPEGMGAWDAMECNWPDHAPSHWMPLPAPPTGDT